MAVLEAAIYELAPEEYAPWLYAGTQVLIPAGGLSVAQRSAAQSFENIAPKSETFYRTMSQADHQTLLRTGKLPPTAETFTSPTRAFSEAYEGVTVEFRVNAGTTESLSTIGVRDASAVARQAYPNMPTVSEGWTAQNAFFKGEGGQVNIGLGRGDALDLFNNNIQSFEALPR
jgi:hypothetical protein